MLINFEYTFYSVMVFSIVGVFWLEALIPLGQDNWNIQHLGRNFTIWLLAFLSADYLVGYYWIDFQALLLQQPFGVFYWFSMPQSWLLITLGLLIIDLADYLYHRLSHRLGFLWRFHSVHHTDTQLDISTTLRSHPIDLVLSNFWKIGFALIFGLPLWLIAFREVFLWPSIFLQHANVSLHKGLENALGKLIITPVIHRHHHSIIRAEHDSNYGEGLVLWDKIFGSFQKPLASRPKVYGVQNCESDKYQTIDGMLLTPFYMGSRKQLH